MANKKLVLDAGHGLYTAGKRTLNGANGVVHEWTMNNNVCNKIQAILKDYNVDIIRTDDTTGKTDVSLNERVRRTNAQKPDLFVSIHHNANASKWGSHGGTEVYWHTNGTAEDKKVANILAPKLASKTGLRNRGVKQAKFAVLGCQPTAILVEGGFMDSTTDYSVITSEKGQQAYAQAVAETIIEYLGLAKVKNTQSAQSTGQVKLGENDLWLTTTDELNVRSKRNYTSSIVTVIPKGTKVHVGYAMYLNNSAKPVAGNSDLWVYISYNGKNGFVNSRYLK